MKLNKGKCHVLLASGYKYECISGRELVKGNFGRVLKQKLQCIVIGRDLNVNEYVSSLFIKLGRHYSHY